MKTIEHSCWFRLVLTQTLDSVISAWRQGLLAVLFCGLLTASTSLATTQSWVTVFSESFEGSFPGMNWSVGNSSTNGPTWDDVNSVFGGEGTHAGGWKGYCAGTIYPFNSSELFPTYTNNMAAFMSRSLNLSGYKSATLDFWHKIPSIETNFDRARVFMDATQIWSQTVSVGAWSMVHLPLDAYVGGVHTLRFQFDSDGSVTREGWYLDDISVTGELGEAPIIASQPASQTALVGSNVVFSVTADGTPPLRYRWQMNGAAIPGATNDTYASASVQLSDAGQYRVVVSNEFGSITSAVATLTVLQPPFITVQPQGRSVPVGATQTLSVMAGGSPSLSYQWRFNGGNLPGATGSSYTIYNAQPVHSGDYDVRVSNTAGSATSTVARLTVALAPRGSVWRFLDDGSDQRVAWRELGFDDSAWRSGPGRLGFGEGNEATVVSNHLQITTYFRCVFPVSSPALYTNLIVRLLRDDGAVVYLNGVEILRTNLPAGDLTYTTPATRAVSSPEENTYFDTPIDPRLLAEGLNVLAAEVHQVSALSLDLGFDLELFPSGRDLPNLRAQPVSRIVAPGTSNVTFTVNATGSGPLAYRWLLNGIRIPGANSASFSISNVRATNGGCYRAVVTNPNGSVISDAATLLVDVPDSPPAADNFSQRTNVLGASGAVRGTNAPAGKEPGEPNHAGHPGGRSVWYTWAAPSTGIATFTLRGSCFDTLLAVYTGASVTNLTAVAASDDSGGYFTSTVQFNTRQGTNYQIAIDGTGASGASGPFVLNWSLETTAQRVPVFTNVPASQGALLGSNVTLRAGADAAANYQWFFNSRPIPFAASPTLTLNNLQVTDAGCYSVRLSNGAGRVTYSEPAALEIGTLAQQVFICKRSEIEHASAQYGSNPALAAIIRPAEVSNTVAGTIQLMGADAGFVGSTGVPFDEASGSFFGTEVGNGMHYLRITNVDGLRIELDTEGSKMANKVDEAFTLLSVFDDKGASVWCDGGWDSAPDCHLIARDITSCKESKASHLCLPPTPIKTAVNIVVGAYDCNGSCLPPNLVIRARVGPRFLFLQPNQQFTLGIAQRAWVPPAKYRWLRNGQYITPESTASSLTTSAPGCGAAGVYSVLVTNEAGNALTFNVAIVLVNEKCRLFPELIPRGNDDFDFRVVGIGWKPFRLEASTLLTLPSWTQLAINTNTNCVLSYIVTNASKSQAGAPYYQFFKATPIPPDTGQKPTFPSPCPPSFFQPGL